MKIESLYMLIQDQILAIDDVEIEEALSSVLATQLVDKIKIRMSASLEGGTPKVRFDVFNKFGSLIKIVRVPMNSVSLLKDQLIADDWLNRIFAEYRSRRTRELEMEIDKIELELFGK